MSKVEIRQVGPHVPAMTGAFVRDNLIARFAGQPLLTSVL